MSMNPVTHSTRTTQSAFAGTASLQARQTMPQPAKPLRFGNNSLIKPSSLGRFNFAALKPHLPFIAVASSIGLMLLNKITGGLGNIKWKWPQNPFSPAKPNVHDLERQAPQDNQQARSIPDELPATVQSPAATKTFQSDISREPAVQDLNASVNSDDTIREPKAAQRPERPHPVAIRLHPANEGEETATADMAKPRPEPEANQSVLLTELTESNLQALLHSPTIADLLKSPTPLSPMSTGTSHSFEMLDEEDWEKAVISLSNSPFNIGSPAHQSRPHSPTVPEAPHRPEHRARL